MGRGIAQVAAVSGREVRLVDQEVEILEAARAEIENRLRRAVQKGRLKESTVEEVQGRITPSTDLESACEDADLVLEAVLEQEAVKREVLSTADGSAPAEAILASNTSSISITWLAGQTGRPEQVVGLHFFNPVPVMDGVELVRAIQTSDRTLERAETFARALGKKPVRVNDSPGFVSNRVLMPMINEAIFCVMEGVAEPEEVDAVMELGMAHPMGPLELADLIGLDVCLSILEVLHGDLGDDKYRPCPLLRKMVDAGRTGRKSGRGFYRYPREE